MARERVGLAITSNGTSRRSRSTFLRCSFIVSLHSCPVVIFGPRPDLADRDDGELRPAAGFRGVVRLRQAVPARRAQRLGGRVQVFEPRHREGVHSSGWHERGPARDRVFAPRPRRLARPLDDVHDGHRRAADANLRPPRSGLTPGGGQSRRLLVPRRGHGPSHGDDVRREDRARRGGHRHRQLRHEPPRQEGPLVLRGGVRPGRQGLLARLRPRLTIRDEMDAAYRGERTTPSRAAGWIR